MSRLLLAAGAVAALAGAAQAQRLDVDPARTTSYDKPIAARPGDVVASELSDSDMSPFPGWRAEHFVFTGRAGETVTVQARSEIPTLVVSILESRRKEITRGPAKDAPLRVVLPHDGTYFVVVGANGPQRNGKYLLTFGSGDESASTPKTAPVQAARTSAPASPRVDIAAEPNSFVRPYPVHAGQLIASELSATDVASGVERSAEYLLFTGRAGEVVTARLRSDIPSLEVLIRSWRSRTGKALAEGPARDAPVRLVLPKDDEYVIVVHSSGPQRFGKYLLSFGSGDSAPPFEPPKAAPVQVAQAAPVPAAPKAAAAPSKASARVTAPVLPVVPGVTNLRAGQVLTRPPGKAGPKVETFRFLAAAGTRVYATARGEGPVVMTAYTPEGAAMLEAEGAGSASLEVIAPIDGIYFLTVGRKTAAKGYRLTLAATEAKLLDADFIERIGYEVPEANGGSRWSCWIEPGVKSLSHASNGVSITYTYLGEGRGRADWTREGRSQTSTWTRRVEGDEIVVEYPNGTKSRYTPFTGPHGAYRGYLCK